MLLDVCAGVYIVLHMSFFFFFIVHSDRTSGSSDACCCTLEVLYRAVDLLPHRCVSRAKFLLSGSGGSDSPAGSFPPSWAMYRSVTQQFSNAELCEQVVPPHVPVQDADQGTAGGGL